MNNFKEYEDYLSGKKFSSDLSVKYNCDGPVVEKMDYILELIKGKKVIDLGFADHYPLIEERMKTNSWVHGIFRKNASKILGVDVDNEAIQYLRSKFNFTDVYYHDITSETLLQPILEEKWDYIILSEVLEHIPDPAAFLKAIKKNYGQYIDKIIISVPNAYGLITLKSVWKGIERINSDHKFWFTPYTLASVLSSAGFKIENFVLCNSYFPLSKMDRYLVKKSPLLHHTLLAVAEMPR